MISMFVMEIDDYRLVVNKLAVMLFVLPEIKAQVDAMWEQMNKGVSSKILRSMANKHNSPPKKTEKKTSSVSSFWHFLLFCFLKNFLLYRCFWKKIFRQILA